MSIKWGVLGTASIARGCTIPGMLKAKGCELYAIAGRNEDKLKAFKDEFGFKVSYNGYDKLLEDDEVQAVYIPLPNNIHAEWVIAALRKKKHVLCEKPLAMDPAEARKMYEEARKNNVILAEAYAYLQSPYIKALKDDIKSGIIGDVDYIETAFVTQGYKEDFRLHKELGGGAMYDLGCYCTTMILSLIDDEIETVNAIAEFGEDNVDVLTTAILKFKNGARASFDVGMVLGKNTNSRYDRLYVHGSKGDIISDVEYNEQGELKYIINSGNEKTERVVFAPSNYTLEIEQLNECIEGRAVPLVSEEFSIKNADLIDDILHKIGYYGTT